jgi:hypothetical protein
MQCDCGNKTWVEAYRVTHGQSQTCRQCTKVGSRNLLKVEIGTRFGSRIVLKTKLVKHSQYLLLECVCGEVRWVQASRVREGSKCKLCVSVLKANRQFYPNLTEKELQRILKLKIFEKLISKLGD